MSSADSCIFRYFIGGRTYVNVLKNGIRQERDVEIGIGTPTEVEIRQGLAVGELIIRQ